VAEFESEGGSEMIIDDDTLKQLLRIDDELMQLCKWLNERRETTVSARLIPLVEAYDAHAGLPMR
jgi:hypothetical protein